MCEADDTGDGWGLDVGRERIAQHVYTGNMLARAGLEATGLQRRWQWQRVAAAVKAAVFRRRRRRRARGGAGSQAVGGDGKTATLLVPLKGQHCDYSPTARPRT